MADLVIKGATVVDPSQGLEKKTDLSFENGKVKEAGSGLKGKKTIDAAGMVVIPGMIDMHVHLRQPGREDEETVETGQKAAIAGGVTSLCSMPNTDPVADKESVVRFVLKQADERLADIYPLGAITKELKGAELAEMDTMAKAGAIAFSDDGNSVMDSSVMLKACQYSLMVDKPLVIHAEDTDLTNGAQMHEGIVSTELGLKGAPGIAEEFIVARDIMLCAYTGARIHFAHVSTAGSVSLIRKAKESNLKITAEASPHHLVLDDSFLGGYDSNYKVNPPLRSKDDRDALIEGLIDGTIDAIATDHAPHSLEEKEAEFIYAPPGMVGLETLAGLIFGKLVPEGKIGLSQAVAKLTVEPARIMGLNEKGALQKGFYGDAVIMDLNKEVTIDPTKFQSKSKNTPFGGWKVKAEVKAVIKNGKLVYENGDFVA